MRAIIIGLAAGLVLTACERVVDITVPDGPVRLVVEARLEARTSRDGEAMPVRVPQVIHLSTTAPYFANGTSTPATGAAVQVVDEAGRVTVFRESQTAPGTFISDSLSVTVGRSYTLRIQWNGDQYESTETVSRAVVIDSLFFQARPFENAATDGIRATLAAVDPVDEKNYYLWEQWVNGVRLVSTDTALWHRAVESDDFYNGSRIGAYQPFNMVRVHSGDVVILRQYALSKSGYDYYVGLNSSIGGDGSPFSTPVFSLRGNVRNTTDASRRALGYFLASEYSERQRLVP